MAASFAGSALKHPPPATGQSLVRIVLISAIYEVMQAAPGQVSS